MINLLKPLVVNKSGLTFFRPIHAGEQDPISHGIPVFHRIIIT